MTGSPFADAYVVVFFDRWEDSISFIMGPYDNLADAQNARARAEEKIQGDHRQASIQKCRTLQTLPEWERT